MTEWQKAKLAYTVFMAHMLSGVIGISGYPNFLISTKSMSLL